VEKPEATHEIKTSFKAIYPPAEEIYRSKITVKEECVKFGLNMYFKKAHQFG